MSESNNNYVLAMYDVRGKQKFIYRSQHLKEIIGGSAIIRDVFKDYLYPAANQVRDDDPTMGIRNGEAIHSYDPEKNDDKFSLARFDGWMKGDQYIGEVVYDGGGNFLVLFRNADYCKKVTAEFTRMLLTGDKHRRLPAIPTLKVICTYVDNLDEKDFIHDWKHRLYARHRFTENQETPMAPCGTLPIVQVDPLTSMPLTHYYKTVVDRQKEEKSESVTTEAYAKYSKYSEVYKEFIDSEKILDNMVTEKGNESLLAVIHIDGNNMGAMVQQCLDGHKEYDDCVNRLRSFSKIIQDEFIENRKAGIDATIDATSGQHGRRLVIGAGDDFTIITNARDALAVTNNYLRELSENVSSDIVDEYGCMSSCAGISIFHSHAPFADAYRIAEEACETGKQYMKLKHQAVDSNKNRDNRTSWENACMIDYHFNQGVIGTSLEDIRIHEETEQYAIPWLISGSANGPVADTGDIDFCRDVNEMAKYLQLFNRGNTKGLLQAAVESNGALTMEVNRILAHIDISEKADPQGEKAALVNQARKELFDAAGMITEKARGLMIRMIPVYDIWFNQDKEEQ